MGVTARPRDRETPQPHHWVAILLLFLVATAWGASFTVVKDVLADIAPEPFIFLRFTLAGLVSRRWRWRAAAAFRAPPSAPA